MMHAKSKDSVVEVAIHKDLLTEDLLMLALKKLGGRLSNETNTQSPLLEYPVPRLYIVPGTAL